MPDTDSAARWLDDTEMRAWRCFLTLHARLRARLNRDLQRTSGLSLADYDVLVHLTDVPGGRRRAFELGQSLEWEKSRLSKQIGRMEARGLVAKEPCEVDRRGFFVVLTETGRRAIEDAAPPHVAMVRHLVFDALSDQQSAAMADVLSTVLERVEALDR